MSIQRNIFGFETGSQADLTTAQTGWTFVAAAARTGGYGARFVKSPAATGGQISWTFTALAAVPGEEVKGVCRFFLRPQALPSVSDHSVGGFVWGGQATVIQGMILDTTGHFASYSNGVGTYSTATLSTGTWYEVRVTILIHNDSSMFAVDDYIKVDVDVYNSTTGALIESVTRTSTSISNFQLSGWKLGGDTNVSATIQFDADDATMVMVDNADLASAVLPSGKRIFPVPPTGNSTTNDWTGDFTDVDDDPFNAANLDAETATADAQTQLYTHDGAVGIAADDIDVFKLHSLVKSTDGSTHALMIGATEYSVAYPTSYAHKVAIDWTSYTEDQFNALEFGVRHKTGTATTSLNAILGESLANKAFRFTGSGTLLLSGTAVVLMVPPFLFTGSGTLLLSGTATVLMVPPFTFIGSGTLLIGGSAVLRMMMAVTNRPCSRKKIEVQVQNLLDQAGETGTSVTLIQDAIKTANEKRLTEDNWSFMLWPSYIQLDFTTGQRVYQLHPEVLQLEEFRLEDDGEHLIEVPSRSKLRVAAQGKDPRFFFEFIEPSPVHTQPSTTGLVTVVSTSATENGEVDIKYLDSNGDVIEETLTLNGLTAVPTTSSVLADVGILNIVKVDDTWDVGNIVFKDAAGNTLLTLSAAQTGKSYPRIQLYGDGVTGETADYKFYRIPKVITRDNDVVDIPYPYCNVLIYDTLMEIAAYNDSRPNEVWVSRQADWDFQMRQAFQEGNMASSLSRQVHEVDQYAG